MTLSTIESMHEQFKMLGRYNALANRLLYDACGGLSDEERKLARPAFFGSIHGTLNHIMVGDRIWMTRFEGREAPSTNLNAILYEDFGELRSAREAEDARIEAFMAGLADELPGGGIRYRNNEGNWHEDPLPLLLTHFFNHQTHHRGQVHGLLSHAGVKTPVLDLHRVLRPHPEG